MAERTCLFDECVREVRAKGLCNTHYHMRRRGQPLMPFDGMDRPERRCSFDGCPGPATTRNLCAGHYRQFRLGKPLTPVRRKRTRGESLTRNERGEKECTACGEWKEESEFQRHANTADGLDPRCRPCNSSRMAAWKSDPEVALRAQVKAHGMTIPQFSELLAAQGGVCAICGTEMGGGKRARLSIDHDHGCCPGRTSCGKCVRGLLCSSCNSALGYFGDDPSRLSAAIAYLGR